MYLLYLNNRNEENDREYKKPVDFSEKRNRLSLWETAFFCERTNRNHWDKYTSTLVYDLHGKADRAIRLLKIYSSQGKTQF